MQCLKLPTSQLSNKEKFKNAKKVFDLRRIAKVIGYKSFHFEEGKKYPTNKYFTINYIKTLQNHDTKSARSLLVEIIA